MDGEVALGGGGVVAHLAPIWLVAASVCLTPCKTRVLLVGDAIDALGVALWMFVFHVDFQGLLVLIVPIALGTLQCLVCISSHCPRFFPQLRGIEDEVAFLTLDAWLSPGHMIWTWPDGGSLQLGGVRWGRHSWSRTHHAQHVGKGRWGKWQAER